MSMPVLSCRVLLRLSTCKQVASFAAHVPILPSNPTMTTMTSVSPEALHHKTSNRSPGRRIYALFALPAGLPQGITSHLVAAEAAAAATETATATTEATAAATVAAELAAAAATQAGVFHQARGHRLPSL